MSMDDKTASMDDKTATMDDKTATMVIVFFRNSKRPDGVWDIRALIHYNTCLLLNKNNTAVFGAASFGVVVGNGFVRALTYGTHIERIAAEAFESLDH